MAIVSIAQANDVKQITSKNEPFTCLLHENCPFEADVLKQNGQCIGVALIQQRSFARKRRQHIAEFALSQEYGCPVRVFHNEDKARQWLSKRLLQQQ